MNKNENENSLTQTISEIKEDIQKVLQNTEFIKKKYNEDNEEIIYDDIEIKNKSRTKKYKLHITFFIPVLQFLDIQSLIELSKVNHLFYSFIYSFYFYRSVNQIITYSKKSKNNNKINYNNNKRKIEQIKSKISDKSSENNNQNNQSNDGIILGPTKKIYSGFMSAITGALSYITPMPEMTSRPKEKNELEEIEKKIKLHEKLIDERIKQLAISNEIKNTRDEINNYIKEQYNLKKSQKKNELNKNNYKYKKIDDKTIEKLKREKYESEYRALMQEINEYEMKYNDLQKENEIQNKIGIDLETKNNKIKYYAKNIFNPNKSV